MQREVRDDQAEPNRSAPEETPYIDFEPDQMTVVDEDEAASADPEEALAPTGEPSPTQPLAASYQVDLDDLLVGFVEVFNARDWEGVADLLSAGATSDYFEASTSDELVTGVSDLSLRFPTLVITRGDLGDDPIAAAWLLNQELDRYGLVGYFRLEIDDSDEPRISNLEYIEEIPDTTDAILEAPEGTEIAEWEDWSLAESGE